nr:Chain B, Integrin alpha-4 [Homo sapiens]5FPI_B Chain B, INTEGRIN ALPHA-4 SUBUNIT [Homo sapiens]
QYKSILQE